MASKPKKDSTETYQEKIQQHGKPSEKQFLSQIQQEFPSTKTEFYTEVDDNDPTLVLGTFTMINGKPVIGGYGTEYVNGKKVKIATDEEGNPRKITDIMTNEEIDKVKGVTADDRKILDNLQNKSYIDTYDGYTEKLRDDISELDIYSLPDPVNTKKDISNDAIDIASISTPKIVDIIPIKKKKKTDEFGD